MNIEHVNTYYKEGSEDDVEGVTVGFSSETFVNGELMSSAKVINSEYNREIIGEDEYNTLSNTLINGTIGIVGHKGLEKIKQGLVQKKLSLDKLERINLLSLGITVDDIEEDEITAGLMLKGLSKK